MKLRQTSSKFEYQNLIQKLFRLPKYFSQEYGLIAETCRLWGGGRQKWFQFYCEDWEDSPKKTLKTILWLMLRKVSDWTGMRQCRPTLSTEFSMQPLQFKIWFSLVNLLNKSYWSNYGKIPVLVSSLKMYSLIIVDNPKNAFIPNIYVPLQITNMVT